MFENRSNETNKMTDSKIELGTFDLTRARKLEVR